MEIITDRYPEEGKDQVTLESIACTYIQEADCTEDRDDVQEIVLSTRDGGGGKFININTKSWSIDSEDTLVELIKHFKKLYEGTNNS